jgi:glycosyltransferase involved in cell wall biosynthesis
MNNDLVTAIVPTYNYGRFVTQAVESVLAQTYPNVEILVVDDGSTDDTRERLRPYADRIRYIYQENQSVAAARNTGIQAAKGDLIAFLDADDLWHPHKLEVQVRYLTDHPSIKLVAVERLAPSAESWPPLANIGHARARPITVEELVLQPHFAPSGVLARKQCFDTVGFFDTTLRNAEDYDMWIRIACHFPVVKLEVPLWWYRVHGNNKSQVPGRQEAAGLRVLEKTFAKASPLHARWLLKRKTYSYAAYAAALNYSAERMEMLALARILRSFLLWPIPYHRCEVTTSLARPKKLVITVLRMLHLVAGAPPTTSVLSNGPAPQRVASINSHVAGPAHLPHRQIVHERTQ